MPVAAFADAYSTVERSDAAVITITRRVPNSNFVNKGKTMCRPMRWMLVSGWFASASALTPLPDTSPAAFAGEWAGTGEQASYCYVQLGADGWGRVLVDGGAGDWFGARIRWRNWQQGLQVDRVIPAEVSTQLRIMPLKTLVLRSGFNQSLSLTWNERLSACQLQRTELTAHRLDRARSALEGLQSGEGKR